MNVKLKQHAANAYILLLTTTVAFLFSLQFVKAQQIVTPVSHGSVIRYQHHLVDGVRIAYRSAGNPSKPAIVLLHGFPSSSHMFRDLIPLLAKDYYVIAPDYPGFGQSDTPDPTSFQYTFDNISITIENLLNKLGIDKMYLYVHDYGGPVGFRIASGNPSRIKGLIIQNANAYQDGWGPAAAGLMNYIDVPSDSNRLDIAMFLTLAGTKYQYQSGAADTSLISPDGYMLDQYYLDRPGNSEIQFALFRDYKSNLQLYANWQAYFRKQQPKTLILWGKNDPIFVEKGAMAYKRDLPDSNIFLYDGGHFLLAEIPHEIHNRIKLFISRIER